MTAPIDHHLENLGTYIKDRLNESGAALSDPMIVVEDVTYLTDFNSVDKFPLLQIYRIGGKGWGEETQQWEINYSLTNYADPYDVARILAWIVESHNSENIRSLLVNYFSQTQCDGMRLDVGSISWSYGYKFLGANKVPSLRVGFTLSP